MFDYVSAFICITALQQSDQIRRQIEKNVAVTSLVKTDDLTLPWRRITALRDLPKNNNMVIPPSDKSVVIVIMDSTYCNNKIMELFNDKNT